MTRRGWLALLGLSAMVGCITENPTIDERREGEYLSASPIMQDQIDRRVKELAHLQNQDLVEAVGWLSQRGETAYEAVFDVLDHEKPKVRCAAVAVLAAGRDRRMVDTIRELADDDHQRVRLEVARALMHLGDWSGLGTLIEGLSSESLYVRANCLKFLKEHTQMDFNYRADASPQERRAAIVEWQSWYERVTRSTSED